jgi:hypothetical protein
MGSAADTDPDEASTLLDEVHLALIKGVSGAPPAQVCVAGRAFVCQSLLCCAGVRCAVLRVLAAALLTLFKQPAT